jgi:hypothetical protein
MNAVPWIKFYIIASAPSDLILLSKERPLLFKNVLLKAF